jgi:hypothetical protein
MSDPNKWKADEVEQRASLARLSKLQTMAHARGCKLYMDGPLDDDTDFSKGLDAPEDDVYLLFVGDYPEPVEFDDLDEVEFDLNSRPFVKRRTRARGAA